MNASGGSRDAGPEPNPFNAPRGRLLSSLDARRATQNFWLTEKYQNWFSDV